MAEQYRTIKIRLETYRVLKVLAAESGETLVGLLERLAHEGRSSNIDSRIDSHNKKRGTGDKPDTAS